VLPLSAILILPASHSLGLAQPIQSPGWSAFFRSVDADSSDVRGQAHAFFKSKSAQDDSCEETAQFVRNVRDLRAMPKTQGARTTPEADDEVDADSREASAADPSGPRPRLGWTAWFGTVWPVLCFLQLGILVGLWQAGVGSSLLALPTPVAPPPESRAILPAEPIEKELAVEVERGEDYIREGRYDLALATYSKSTSDKAAAADDLLQYRLALCNEGLGRWDQAVAAYRSVASRKATAQLAAAAQMGQARVWVRLRRPTEARPLLGDLILRSAQPGLREGPFLADARYLLALAVSAEALPAARPAPYNGAPAGRVGTEWPVERFLDWATAAKGAGKPPRPGKTFLTVQCLGPTPAEVLISAFWPSIPAADLLDQVSSRSQFQCRWSAQAREQAVGRSVQLDVETLPLPDLLRAVADPLGLVWEVQGRSLQLSLAAEMPASALAAYRARTAAHALRGAILAHPGHPLSAAAYLDLGNLEMRANRPTEAVSWYDRLQREWPRTSEAVAAAYNLGLAQTRLGHPAEARQALFRLVDQAPAHELTPLAYWQIGRLFLEEDNDALRAIAPLRRAVATSLGSAAQPAAAVLLALAYIEENNPRAAIALLLQYREAVTASPYCEAAGFLNAYARYRSAADAQERERQAGDLLAAMLLLHDPTPLGSAGQLVLGRAYHDLGMVDQTARLYQAILPGLHGPVAAEMAYNLADALEQSEHHDDAVRAWTSLATSGTSHWHRLARFRLAELAFDRGQTAVCLDHCRQLLRAPELNELPTILRLMGRAYEAQGKHTEAARCFAGELPEE